MLTGLEPLGDYAGPHGGNVRIQIVGAESRRQECSIGDITLRIGSNHVVYALVLADSLHVRFTEHRLSD